MSSNRETFVLYNLSPILEEKESQPFCRLFFFGNPASKIEMNPYNAAFLIQMVGIAVLSQCFCDGFQSTTISSSRNVIRQGREKNELRAPLPRIPITTATTTIKTTHLSSTDRFNENDDEHDSLEHTITVHYENRSCDILARSDETILTALERNQLSLENLGLPNAAIPSDCRRGNCLTCTGTHASVSSRRASGTAVVCDGDGLSPHVSKTIRDKGYILTCSTRVVGEGLQLNLGENHKVWSDIYQDRLEKEPTQEEKWAAMARSKRKSDERNEARWKIQMEDLVGDKDGSENF